MLNLYQEYILNFHIIFCRLLIFACLEICDVFHICRFCRSSRSSWVNTRQWFICSKCCCSWNDNGHGIHNGSSYTGTQINSKHFLSCMTPYSGSCTMYMSHKNILTVIQHTLVLFGYFVVSFYSRISHSVFHGTPGFRGVDKWVLQKFFLIISIFYT